MEVKPLTLQNRTGKVYTRDDSVETEIEAALRLDVFSILQHADDGYFKEETLVYLIRHFRQLDHDQTACRLFGTLVKRSVSIIRHYLRTLRREDFDDGFNEAVNKMSESIWSKAGNQADFWEVRFGRALKWVVIPIWHTYNNQYESEPEIIPIISTTEDENGFDSTQWAEGISEEHLADHAPSPEDLLIWKEALSAITNPKHRKAFILHYYYGFQIESIDPSQATLTDYFPVDPRTIHNWLKTAENQLRQWRGDR